MNRLIIRTLLLVTLFVLAACAKQSESTGSDVRGLTFIHLNDTYRVADVEEGMRGGFGRAITVIRQAQAEGRDVRVLHGGDLLSPSLESQVWHGEQMVKAMNFIDDIAPAYFVVGNHEFDFSDDPQRDEIKYLAQAIKGSRFDWLGDNYKIKTGDPDADTQIKQAFTFDAGDKTIGVFALALDNKGCCSERSYVEYDTDYLGNAERVILELEAKNVDMIIGITHLHMHIDKELAQLREAHSKLEFIVGGHEHEVHYQDQGDDAAAIFKGASNARVIWRIDVDFDAAGDASIQARQISLHEDEVQKDAEYREFENEWRRKLVALYPSIEATVGYAKYDMDVTEETVRNKESIWGNLIIDQARYAFGDPAADFAFMNSGSIRIDDYIAGDITYEDIGRTFGFPSQTRMMTVTGAEFRILISAGYRGEGRSHGYFPQISGFRVCVDYSKPDADRIVQLQLPDESGWRDIVDTQNYTVVLPDFLFGDRDGYTMPQSGRDSASLPGAELKYLLLDAIIKSQAQGKPVGTEITAANRRYFELETNRQECWP